LEHWQKALAMSEFNFKKALIIGKY
jgi:hypothetical protein